MYNPNQPVINQLMRQKDNIDSLLSQYMQPQAPVQNIINTGIGTEFEARILTDNESIDNILITKRTMFLDKKNKKLSIKEINGDISEEYEIVIPLDEKDKRILELESKVKEMEDKINVKYSEPIKSNINFEQSNANANVINESTTTSVNQSIPKSE